MGDAVPGQETNGLLHQQNRISSLLVLLRGLPHSGSSRADAPRDEEQLILSGVQWLSEL